MDWVLIILKTQVIRKKRPVRPVFPDYLSVSYGYEKIELCWEYKPDTFVPHRLNEEAVDLEWIYQNEAAILDKF